MTHVDARIECGEARVDLARVARGERDAVLPGDLVDQLATCHLARVHLVRLLCVDHLDVHDLRAVLLGNAQREERVHEGQRGAARACAIEDAAASVHGTFLRAAVVVALREQGGHRVRERTGRHWMARRSLGPCRGRAVGGERVRGRRLREDSGTCRLREDRWRGGTCTAIVGYGRYARTSRRSVFIHANVPQRSLSLRCTCTPFLARCRSRRAATPSPPPDAAARPRFR